MNKSWQGSKRMSGRSVRSMMVAAAVVLVTGVYFNGRMRHAMLLRQEAGQAFQVMKKVEKAAGDYHDYKNVWPKSLSDLNMPTHYQRGKASFSADFNGGRLVITFDGDDDLKGKTLVLERTYAWQKASWVCTDGTLDQSYRPRECRNGML